MSHGHKLLCSVEDKARMHYWLCHSRWLLAATWQRRRGRSLFVCHEPVFERSRSSYLWMVREEQWCSFWWSSRKYVKLFVIQGNREWSYALLLCWLYYHYPAVMAGSLNRNLLATFSCCWKWNMAVNPVKGNSMVISRPNPLTLVSHATSKKLAMIHT